MQSGLRCLATARSLAGAGLALVLAIAYVAGISVPFVSLAAAALFVSLAAGLTFLRLRRPQAVTEREFRGQLLVDVAALTWILAFTGHSANPVAGGYVLLVALAATKLGPRPTWKCALLCILCYSIVALLSVPELVALPHWGAHARAYLASAVTFILLVALVAWFGLRVSEMRRQHRSLVARHAERDGRERYLVGLATLCAGTAHEIGTPLTTMALVLGELRGRSNPPADWGERIDVLWSQIQLCRRSLSNMALTTNVERFGKLHRLPAKQLVYDVCDRFRLLRPAVPLRLRKPRIDDSLVLESDETLSQALLNFLNNAADASPIVELRVGKKDRALVIQILDRGPGLAPELREQLDRGPITTKPPGLGCGAGVLIAHAVIERLGGSVQISDRANGGTCVQIELPLSIADQDIDHDDHRQLRVASGSN
jgi:two-component system, sensor histidine kinase RegB